MNIRGENECQTSLGLFWYRLTGLALELKTHALTHLGCPLTNSETTLGTTTVLFIQQLE